MNRLTRVLSFIPAAWFVFFLVGPLLIVMITSFAQRGTYGGTEWVFQFGSYERIAQTIYLNIFLKSLLLGAATCLLTLIISLPVTWHLIGLSETQKWRFISLLSIPFLMNLVIRIYSIRLLVRQDGPIVQVLTFFGWQGNPFVLSQNMFLVQFGMVMTYLPFMLFPIFAALEKFDFQLLHAAEDLGATRLQSYYKIVLPFLRPAIANGCLMVFIPALGEFVIPDLLGGAKTMLVGNLLTEQFLKSRDWPFGSSLTVLLMIVLMLCSYLILKVGGRSSKT